jgi:hypothetical protein
VDYKISISSFPKTARLKGVSFPSRQNSSTVYSFDFSLKSFRIEAHPSFRASSVSDGRCADEKNPLSITVHLNPKQV